MALYCRPSDIVTADATWSVTAGTADSDYPLTNLSDLLAHTVTKSTGTSISLRATFAAAKALAAVAFINTNATAITLTNGAGLSETVAIPTTPNDDLTLDPWIDLRTLANTSSTTWTIALTGPTGVALGLPLLVTTLRTIEILWDPSPVERERHGGIVHRTDYGVKLKLSLGTRERGLRGLVRGAAVRADLRALERDAQGLQRSFLLIPDEDENDALYVDLTTDLREWLFLAPAAGGGTVHDVALDFDEQQKGWL